MTEYDEDLRARLSRIDPAPAGVDVDPVTSPRAQDLLERTMTQSLDTPAETSVTPVSSHPRWRRPAFLTAAATVLVAAAVAVAVPMLTSSDDAPARRTPTSVALTLPAADGGGPTMSSCMMFDVAILRQMPVALAGTVTAVDAERVTLDVDRWYKGGTADQVTIAQPGANTSASLDGVAFEQGKRYLLTATDGTVNGCGFSGPATPELEKSYAEAFGS